MITNVNAVNFKGSTFDEDMSKITLYTGRNSMGKSSRIEALQLAVLGYVPGFSTKPSDVHALFSSGSSMSVSARFSDQRPSVTRTYESRGGSVKYSGPAAEDNPADQVALDPAHYFEMSAPERRKFLFSASGAAKDLTVSSLRAGLKAKAKNIRLEENTEQSEQAIESLVEVINGVQDDNDPQRWLELLAAEAKELHKRAKQDVQRLEKTAQGNAEVSSQDDPAPQDADDQLAACREALRDAEAEVTKLQTQLDAARSEYNAASELAAQAFVESEVRERMASLSKRKEELFRSVANEPNDKDEFHSWQLAVTETVLAQQHEAIVAADLARIEREINHAKSESNCPTCGQSTVEIKKRIVAELEAERAKVKAAHAAAEAEYSRALVASSTLKKSYDDAKSRVDEHRRVSSEFRVLSKEHADLQAKLSVNEKAEEAKSRLPDMKANGVGLKLRHSEAVELAARRREDVSKWDVAAKRLHAERAEAAQAERVREAVAAARAGAVVAKEFSEVVARLQAELVEKSVGPLVQRMNELCGPILPKPVSFRDGELVLGNWSHRTASDSEKLLVYAALSVVLAGGHGNRVAAIGRLESFDAAKKVALVELLSELIESGKLDQAVLVEVSSHSDPAAARWWSGSDPENMRVYEL